MGLGISRKRGNGRLRPLQQQQRVCRISHQCLSQSFFHPSDYAQHGVAIASARAGNVIGGGDWAVDRLIPDTLKSLIAKQPLPIRNPHAIRPWQHVLEPLNGYLTLAEYLDQQGTPFSEAWNFGPNDCDIQPVSWVVDRLFTLWGEGTWQWDRGTQPHEATILKLDSTKARIKLGWQPKLDLQTALAWIVDWTKAWQTGANIRHFTETQIQKFMEIGGT